MDTRRIVSDELERHLTFFLPLGEMSNARAAAALLEVILSDEDYNTH